jgi:hypothetical protein
MRKEKAAGKVIIDRAGSGGRGTIRARLMRTDRYGTVHEERASWNYHDAVTRQDCWRSRQIDHGARLRLTTSTDSEPSPRAR